MASSTATTTIHTMAPPKRPPPPKGPPPKRPPPPPSPPAKKPAPPGVGSGALKRPVEVTVTANAAATANNDSSNPPNKQRRTSHLHIKAPVILRDVTVFQRRQQVGEGTYGYVSLFCRDITAVLLCYVAFCCSVLNKSRQKLLLLMIILL
jgi:hypothetical protein